MTLLPGGICMSEITLPDGTKEKGKHVGRWNLKGMFSNEDSDVYGARSHTDH